MDSIDLMLREHDNILTFLEVIRSACCRVLEGAEIDQGDFRDMIWFARTYADCHHHGKEERILFREMEQRLGPAATHLIRHGMLVEHDLGRMHMAELERALDRYGATPNTRDKLAILTQATGWAELLQRHIEKENNVAYTFARRSLPAEVLRDMDAEVGRFEQAAQAEKTQEFALALLGRLAEKYGV